MLTLPQFLMRLNTEPAFAAKMRAHYESMIAVPASPETDEMRKAAQAALKSLKHRIGVLHALAKLEEADKILEKSAEIPEDDLPHLNALVDGAVDDLLDVMEPERTRIMGMVLELQAVCRRI